jgi:hypothetical protein
MQIALEDGTLLRGDFVLRAVQRFDLTPIPSTLEVVLRADETLGGRVADGSLLLAGSSQDRYRVVKLRRATSEWTQRRDVAADVLEVTAVLDGLSKLALPLPRAVVKEGRSMGEAYRSCGAAVRIGTDVPVWRFLAYAGHFPTIAIAQAMQEEGVVPVWGADKALSFRRLADLFGGLPVESIAADSTRAVESRFLEQHEIPTAAATAPDGSVILGRRDTPRAVLHVPRAPARVLDNMTKALVVRRTMNGSFAGHIRAGDGFDVAGVRHVVTTAAHAWQAGSDGSASTQSTQLWLAVLQR